MKTQNLKTSKKMKNSEPIQDLYSIYKSTGLPNEMILSLGYVGLSEDVLYKLPVERRQHLFGICQYLHTVISESMKEKESRDMDKISMFLRLAMDQTDNYYSKTNDGIFLFHSLQPHNQEFKRKYHSDSVTVENHSK